MRPTTRTNGERGFTLIELTLVLVIVGIMLAFALPRLDSLTPKYALRASVREVGSIIDLARGSAAAKNRRYAILYEVSNGRSQAQPLRP